jgi:hypothetical protein
MTVYVAGLTVIAVLGVIAYLVLSLWAAREDGRDQKRRDSGHRR